MEKIEICLLDRNSKHFLHKFREFQPAHGLLVQFVVKQRQTLGHGSNIVHADGAAT